MRKMPKTLDTYDAVLRYYQFETQQSVESALEAFQALEQARQKDPTRGTAIAMLASLCGNTYMLDAPDSTEAFEKMSELAEKAIKLDPNRQRVRIIYAWKCFVCNEKSQFLKEADTALSLNPNSPLRLGALGFHLSLYGEWKRGKVLLDSAMEHNTGFPRFFYGTKTLYYYRIFDYKRTLEEAKRYDVPALFWAPMLLATVLGQLGQINDAQSELKSIIRLKPDFKSKAEYLISLFVKEETLVEQILKGLQKAGLKPAKS